MEDSILTTIKKLLGLGSEYVAFDEDILVHINSVIDDMNQAGISNVSEYVDKDSIWSTFFASDSEDSPKFYNSMKSYIYLRVRLIFDPPANATILKAMQEEINRREISLYTLQGGY